MRTCNTCGEEKNLEEFVKETKVKCNYRRHKCKECKNAARRTGKINPKLFKKGMIPWNKKFPVSDKAAKKIRFSSFETKEWKKGVKLRDGNNCTICRSVENLHIHHIVPWKDNLELRYEISNGQTLCGSCHARVEGYQKDGIPWNKGKKGQIPWNKGIPMREETKNKMRETRKLRLSLIGENNG